MITSRYQKCQVVLIMMISSISTLNAAQDSSRHTFVGALAVAVIPIEGYVVDYNSYIPVGFGITACSVGSDWRFTVDLSSYPSRYQLPSGRLGEYKWAFQVSMVAGYNIFSWLDNSLRLEGEFGLQLHVNDRFIEWKANGVTLPLGLACSYYIDNWYISTSGRMAYLPPLGGISENLWAFVKVGYRI